MLVGTIGQELTLAEQRDLQQTEEDFAEYLSAETTEEELLHTITKDGVQSLIQHKIDQLKKKLTEDAMAARGVNQESLAAMPEDQRLAMMKSIMDEVAQALKKQFSEQMQRDMENELKRKEGIEFVFSPAKVDSESMLQLLMAQEGSPSATT